MLMTSDIELINSFCEEAMLNKHSSVWVKRRKDNCQYGMILITSRGYNWGEDRGMRCWWDDFVGLEVFARLEFKEYRGKIILKEAYPVRLTGTKMIEGRGIAADSFSLI